MSERAREQERKKRKRVNESETENERNRGVKRRGREKVTTKEVREGQ